MRRWLWAGAVLAAVAAALAWQLRERPPVEGPAEVPMGGTVSQVLPGPDGEPEVWTRSKREGTLVEESAQPVPRPRESPP